MAQHLVTSNYYSGQGIVMIATKNSTTGEPEGFVPVGNVTALSLETSITKDEHKESTSGSRAVDKVLATETSISFSATMESLNQENLAYALRGTTADIPAGTQTVTSYTARLGKIEPLGHIKVSAVVIQDDADTNTYVEGDNYRLDADTGSIYIMTAAEQTAALAVNSITDLDTLHIAYSFEDQKVMNALTGAAEVRWVRFEGLNTADSNAPVVVDIFKMEADLLATLALISDDIQSADLTGAVLSDSTRQSGSKHFKQTSLT
ncbi:MAG: hypothetical protein GQ570_03880 [Helicobacteraceae bacterium]|nr:hypothetical protein [Helicobacteraceae bacterium]